MENRQKMQADISKITFRKSRETDEAALRRLFVSSIGEREHMFEKLDGSYLVAELAGQIIAASGICYNEEYRGYELDYTATLKEYRESGVMNELVGRLVSGQKGRLYCCAWRIGENDRCNLYGVLKRNGFKEVLHPVSAYQRGLNCFYGRPEDCPYMKLKETCFCYEDLWVKEDE